MKKNIGKMLILASFALTALSASADTIPQWDVSGTHELTFNYQGSDYTHEVTLSQNGAGDLSGNGGFPVGDSPVYTWVVDSGNVTGADIELTAHYTAPSDATTPLTTMELEGTIDSDGSVSGTWSDNYQGSDRSGTWTMAADAAEELGALNAEDFGVVNYDTGLGMLKGYSAGFGLTDATFEDVQSVVVQLFAGTTLLQTNTATDKLGDEITGNQISSPFDVSGTFDYEEDGFWVNVRESQYGQSTPATRVVATVTLENGKVLTATNTNLSGDPTTIYPVTPPVVTPTSKDQCKNGGWKTFTNPSFKNQGQCVSSTNR